MKDKAFSGQTARKRFREYFAGHGISPERIDLYASLPTTAEHLNLYGRIDIGLDPVSLQRDYDDM